MKFWKTVADSERNTENCSILWPRSYRHDPIGINFEVNTDEYESEAGTILPKLRSCRSADDCCSKPYTQSLFGGLISTPMVPPEHYKEIAF